MDTLKVINILVTLILFSAFFYELVFILKKAIARESFQAINELKFEELVAPSITLCPGTAWKSPAPFIGTDIKITV